MKPAKNKAKRKLHKPSTEGRRVCGKPLSYWQRKADELVVYHLVRAIGHCDRRSIIGELAAPKLWEMANSISPQLVKDVLEEQGRCQAGFAAIMNDILSHPKKHPTLHRALGSVGIR